MTLTDIVFAGVFASQVYLLSFHVPRTLTTDLTGESAQWRQALQTSRLYATANRVLVAVGASLLVAFFFADTLAAMTPALLAVGGFFFLQMAPLSIVVGPVLARSPAIRRVPDVSGPVRLADFVSPLAVAMAVALVVAYLGTQLALWDGTWSRQMLKASIFTAVQLLLAGTLQWQLSTSRQADAEDRVERLQALSAMAPMFTLLSIGLSAYYFGKDVLLVLEAQALRPAMMSAFLQLLALLAIHHVLGPGPDKPLPPTDSADD
jgi:hypothetical protein